MDFTLDGGAELGINGDSKRAVDLAVGSFETMVIQTELLTSLLAPGQCVPSLLALGSGSFHHFTPDGGAEL